MKIAKERLKQIISEELTVAFGGTGVANTEDMEESHHSSDPDGYMAKQNLWKMAEYAAKLHDLIGDDEDLEPWVEEKIAIAAFMMDSVGHYMQYEKHRDHEGEEGETEEFEFNGEEDNSDEEEFVLDLGDDEQEEEGEEDEEDRY